MVKLRTSLTENAYTRLRAGLLRGEFSPEERLKIDALCVRYAVGSSAMREALTRLASEGFVVSTPQRGFRVAPLSTQDLLDLTSARCKIEGLCLREAIEKGGVEWEAQVTAALHRVTHFAPASKPVGSEQMETFSKVHGAFHETLAAGCNNPWLMQVRALLFSQSERYRWLSSSQPGKARDLDREHSDLAQAVLARDPDLAVRLMTEHLQRTADAILARANSQHGQAREREFNLVASDAG